MLTPALNLIKSHFAQQGTPPLVKSLESADQWRSLLDFARRHWVSPIIYKALERDRYGVPTEIVGALQSDYYSSARRNVLLLSAVEGVVNHMARAGIDVVVMRGASWAESLYRDIALRPMADVDLLIRPEAIHDMPQLMSNLGYRLLEAVDYCAQFQHEYTKELIEIHWAVGSGSRCFNVAFDSLWSERQPLRLGSRMTNQPSPEDALLLAGFHIGFQHCFAVRLISFLDVYLLTSDPGVAFDWSKLVERASAFKLSHLVFAVLEVTTRLFGHSLPAEVRQELRGHCTRSQLQKVEAFDPAERLVGMSQDQVRLAGAHSDSSPLTRFFWTYRGRDKWRLLAATLRANDSPMDGPEGRKRGLIGSLFRRVPRLLKTYGWPPAKLGLQPPTATGKPEDIKLRR